jgi:exoribonuclease R
MNYTIQIEDREYSKWTIMHQYDHTIVERGEARPGPVGLLDTFHPLQYKLFHEDSFSFNQHHIFTLLYSPIRELGKIIPGILIIADGKTYGRTENKKRLLYKCIPNNRNLPSFLVPYDIKLELSKHIANKYVLFKYVQWTDKHPLGELTETIGTVNNYDAFEQYQLWCKGLTVNISTYTKHIKDRFGETDESTLNHSITQKYQTEDRTGEYVFSIDNDNTTDYDDAMSITENPDGSIRISIYIANVLVWLQEIDGWTQYSDRVSTIYLPTRKIPMLPAHLSENLCSLIEKRQRFAIAMDYVVYVDGSYSVSFVNTKIIVKKNYRYEADNLLRNPRYISILDITHKMDKNIIDSHEVVSYWMIKMNQEVGTLLYKNKMGVFRLAKGSTNNLNLSNETKGLEMETEKMLYNFYNHICSEYKAFKEGEQYTHSAMLVENYVHFTSPIRRLVDLLNQIYIWPLLGYTQTPEMVGFLEKWTSSLKMCYINDTMKAIRRTQTSCELVHMCYNGRNVLHTYMGLVFEKTYIGENYEYTVYIKDLKYLARILCDKNIEIFSEVECRVFVFHDKITVRDKIVLQIL